MKRSRRLARKCWVKAWMMSSREVIQEQVESAWVAMASWRVTLLRRRRAERACAALETAGVPHAVVGGNAVAVWVGMVDQGAIRNTRDVDILLRRDDLERATTALAAAGFIPTRSFGVTMFLDGPDAK